MNQVATTSPRAESPIVALRHELARMDAEFEAVLPRSVRVEEFRRVVLNAIQENPELLAADRQTFFRACLDCARDGNVPDGKEAYFDIRNTKVKVRGQGEVWIQKVVYMPMIRGFYKRAVGKTLKDWRGGVVCENDHFELIQGDEERFIHRPDVFGSNRGKIIGAYSIAVLMDGTISREFMSYADLMKAKAKSPAGNAASGPWNVWEDRMCIKVVTKRHATRLPIGQEAQDLVDRDNELEAPQIAAPAAKPAALAGRKATQQLGALSHQPAANGADHAPQHAQEAPEEHEEAQEQQEEQQRPQPPQEARRGRPSNADREARARRQAEEEMKQEAQNRSAQPAAAAPARTATPKSQPPSATSQRAAGQPATATQRNGGAATASPSEPDDPRDPIGSAWAQGKAAFNAGAQRKPPREFTAANRFQELSAWYDGYDEAEGAEGQEGESDSWVDQDADAAVDRVYS